MIVNDTKYKFFVFVNNFSNKCVNYLINALVGRRVYYTMSKDDVVCCCKDEVSFVHNFVINDLY